MAPLWSDNESMFEFKHELRCTDYAVESTEEEALMIAMYQEPIRHVYQLWKTACQERDEAIDQLQKVVAKNSELQKFLEEFLTSSPLASQIKPESYTPKVTKTIPNATEPNYISDTFNNHSYGSSPSNEILSPPLSNSNMSDSSNSGLLQQPFVQYSSGCIQMSTISSKNTLVDNTSVLIDNPVKGNPLPDFCGSLQMGNKNPVKGKLLPDSSGSIQMGTISSNNAMADGDSVVIDNLAEKRPLPEKGKLLQAVLEAGPLLWTFIVSGPPVPKWRNPPPLSLLHTPLLCSVDGDHGLVNRTAIFDSNSAIPSSSVQNFERGSNSCVNSGHNSLVGINSGFMHQAPIEKRRRLKRKHESFCPFWI